MIKLSSARDEPDSSILYGLQTAKIVTRQTRKHCIAVIEPSENKAGYEHCTCATGQTVPNATYLSQDTKTSRCKVTDVASHRHCRFQVQSKVFHGGNRLDIIKADDETVGRHLMVTPERGTPQSSVFDVWNWSQFDDIQLATSARQISRRRQRDCVSDGSQELTI